MAAAFTRQRSDAYPTKLFSVLLDNSYPAGGYPVSISDVGLKTAVDMLVLGPALAGANFLIAAYDPTTGKIRVFNPVGGTAASPATIAQPVATVVPDAGATTMTGSSAKPTLTATSTPGAGKEVATGADLSAFTIYGYALGV